MSIVKINLWMMKKCYNNYSHISQNIDVEKMSLNVPRLIFLNESWDILISKHRFNPLYIFSPK